MTLSSALAAGHGNRLTSAAHERRGGSWAGAGSNRRTACRHRAGRAVRYAKSAAAARHADAAG